MDPMSKSPRMLCRIWIDKRRGHNIYWWWHTHTIQPASLHNTTCLCHAVNLKGFDWDEWESCARHDGVCMVLGQPLYNGSGGGTSSTAMGARTPSGLEYCNGFEFTGNKGTIQILRNTLEVGGGWNFTIWRYILLKCNNALVVGEG